MVHVMTASQTKIFRYLGFVLLGLAALLLPFIAAAVGYGENKCISSFALTSFFSSGIGLALITIVPKMDVHLKKRDGYLLMAMIWALVSLIGMIPYILSGAVSSPFDALFESCSGFSTTGATIFSAPEMLPRSLLLWRSFTQWLGGMGIIVFASALLPPTGIEDQSVSQKHSSVNVIGKRHARFTGTSARLLMLYLGFSAACLIALRMAGMTFYESLIHMMSTVSTGGFSCYHDSLAHFSGTAVPAVILVFMILSGINYNMFFILKQRGIAVMMRDEEFTAYLRILLFTSIVIFADLIMPRPLSADSGAAGDALFQTVSMVTTTGFTTVNYMRWPVFSQILILLLMMVGACSGSAGSGPKIVRILISCKLVKRSLHTRIHPNRVSEMAMNHRPIRQETATNISNYMFFYFSLIFCGSLIVAADGQDLMTTLSAVISCLCNIGPGFSAIAPGLSYAVFSPAAKAVLSLLMIAGRLELFAVFMLLSPHYWNSNRA